MAVEFALEPVERRMATPEALAASGVLFMPEFLSGAEAARLGSEISAAPYEPARVSTTGGSVVDEAYRRTRAVRVTPDTARTMASVFAGFRSELEAFAGEALGPPQDPVFLRYVPGDFFRPHCDNAGDPRQPPHIRRRRMTVVVFVSQGAGGRRRDHEGGDLRLYRLTDRPRWDDFCVMVPATAGSLVAFPVSVHHEVTEVLRGERCSVVTWYEQAGAGGNGG